MWPAGWHVEMGGHSWTIAPHHGCVALGAVIFVLGGAVAIRSSAGTWGRGAGILALSAIGGWDGARLLAEMLNQASWLGAPQSTQTVTLDGALLLAPVAGWLAARCGGVNPWRMADRLVPWVASAVACARTGCLLRGCCYGTATSLPWGVTFPWNSPAHREQMSRDALAVFTGPEPVHPTQVYELLGVLLIGGASLVLSRRRWQPGVLALASWTAFAAVRLGNLYFRSAWTHAGVGTGMVQCAIVVTGLVLIGSLRRTSPPGP